MISPFLTAVYKALPKEDLTLDCDAAAEFRRLWQYLGPDPGWRTQVSFGDIATACGARRAWDVLAETNRLGWCEVETRREAVAALLPALRRGPAPADVVDRLERWCAGEDVQLRHPRLSETITSAACAEAAAAEAVWCAAYEVVRAASWAVREAGDAAALTAGPDREAAIVARERAHAAELAAQVADLVAAFPPLHGPQKAGDDELPA
jgi:hypothetical protein